MRQQLRAAIQVCAAGAFLGLLVGYAPRVTAGIVLLVALLILSLLAIRRHGRTGVRPSFIAAATALAGTVLVPITWLLGLASPWEELAGREFFVVATGLVFTSSLVLGLLLGMRGGHSVDRPDGPDNQAGLVGVCIATVVLGVVGLFVYLSLLGGPAAATVALNRRKDALAGLGPLLGVAFAPGIACLLVAVTGLFRLGRWAPVLLLANSSVFLAAIYFSGQKSYAVLWVVMLIIVSSRRRPVKVSLIAIMVIVAIPASTYYHYEVRQRPATGNTEGTIELSSPGKFAASVWEPFVTNGLDQLRTLGVATTSAPAVDGNVSPLLEAPLTLIPRNLWRSKPIGAGETFAQLYFPGHYARGTGVPPSAAAEAVWLFGMAGGLLVYGAVGFAISRLDRTTRRLRGMYGKASYGILGAAAMVLVKGGTDSALRVSFLFLMSLVIVWSIHGGIRLLSPRSRTVRIFDPRSEDEPLLRQVGAG